MGRSFLGQLFAELRTNQERVSKTAKLLVWVKASTSADGHQEAIFLKTHWCIWKIDWIWMQKNRPDSQENTYIYGSGTLLTRIMMNSWQKMTFDLAIYLAQRNIPLYILQRWKKATNSFYPSRGIQNPQTEHVWWICRLAFLLCEIFGKHQLIHIILHTASINERPFEIEDLEVLDLEARTKALRLEHPDTQGSMANLASTYWNQCRLGREGRSRSSSWSRYI